MTSEAERISAGSELRVEGGNGRVDVVSVRRAIRPMPTDRVAVELRAHLAGMATADTAAVFVHAIALSLWFVVWTVVRVVGACVYQVRAGAPYMVLRAQGQPGSAAVPCSARTFPDKESAVAGAVLLLRELHANRSSE